VHAGRIFAVIQHDGPRVARLRRSRQLRSAAPTATPAWREPPIAADPPRGAWECARWR
jgi:hypothetical protein